MTNAKPPDAANLSATAEHHFRIARPPTDRTGERVPCPMYDRDSMQHSKQSAPPLRVGRSGLKRSMLPGRTTRGEVQP